MLNTNNHAARKVKTPVGPGMLNGYDKDTDKYQVQISRKDCTVEIESPCLFKFYSAEELEEING